MYSLQCIAPAHGKAIIELLVTNWSESTVI